MSPTARKALERVANLNPRAGEIGAGMLATIVAEAQTALDEEDADLQDAVEQAEADAGWDPTP